MADLNIVYKIAADISGLQDGVNRAAKSAEGLERIAGGMAKVFAGMFTAQAAIAFGKAILDDADALTKLSDRTGISVAGLQRLQVAGDDAGNTIDEMTAAINQMQNRLASGDKSALAALQKLGIVLEDFMRLNPENQLIAMSEALRSIQDPAQQVALAMDVFGRSGAQVLPTLKRGFDDVKGASVGMSDETIRTLEEAGDMMTKFGRTMKTVAAEVLVESVHIVQDGFNPMAHAAGNVGREVQALREELTRMGAAIPVLPKQMAAQLPTVRSDGPEVNAAIKESDKLLRSLEQAQEKAATAAKQHAEAQKRLRDSFDDTTVAANLGVFALNKYGAVELPNVQSSLEGVNRELEALDDNLRDALLEIEGTSVREFNGDLTTLGQHVEVVNDELTDLINSSTFVGPTLEQMGFKEASVDVSDLARSFTQMAQVGGDSFGGIAKGIGIAITGADTLKKSIDSIGAAGADSVKKLAGLASVVGTFITVGREIQGIADQFLPGLANPFEGQQSALDFMRSLGENAEAVIQHMVDLGFTADEAKARLQLLFAESKKGSDEAKVAVGEFKDELARLADLQAGANQFGLSEDQRNAAIKRADDVYKFMLENGTYTAEALAAAHRAAQEAIAKYGTGAAQEAAKAWLATQQAVQSGVTETSKIMEGLLGRRKSLEDSYANEAPEEHMGVMEQLAREQVAAIDQQIEAVKRQAEESAASAQQVADDSARASEEAGDRIAGKFASVEGAIIETVSQLQHFGPEADAARNDIDDAFSGFEIRIPVHFDVENFEAPTGGGGGGNYAAGGGTVTAFGIDPWNLSESMGGPRGTDQIPVWLSEGETVRTPGQEAALAGGGGSVTVENHFHGPVLAEQDYIERVITPGVVRGLELGGTARGRFDLMVKR